MGPYALKAWCISLYMQNANQREEAARRVEIDIYLVFEQRFQRLGALVMQTAPAHIERFQPGTIGGFECLEIAFTQQEIIADHPAQRHQGQEQLMSFSGRDSQDVKF